MQTRREKRKTLRLVAYSLAVVAALVATGLVARSAWLQRPAKDPLGPTVPAKTVVEIGVKLKDAGCVQEAPRDMGAIPSGPKHPAYNSNPPVTGYYYGDVEPGFYGITPPVEQLVGFLNTGGIVVYYTGVSEREVAELNRMSHLLASPWISFVPGEKLNLKQKVTLTAWGRIGRCEQISGEAVASFFRRYAARRKAPSPSPGGH